MKTLHIIDTNHMFVPYVHEFYFSQKKPGEPMEPGYRNPAPMFYGPMVPPTIGRQNHLGPKGNADPVWVRDFTTKFSRVPEPDAPLVTPYGAAKVIADFVNRVETDPAAELAFLIETQDQELATTRAEMAANGIASSALERTDEDNTAAVEVAQSDSTTTHYSPDPAFIAAMSRRIEWERYIYACGPVTRVSFALTQSGELGITYDGPHRRVAETVLAEKRAMKARWLERFGSLPEPTVLRDGQAFAAHYGKPVLALMTAKELAAHRASKKNGVEDIDPGRESFHAIEDPKPHRGLYSYDRCTTERCIEQHTGCRFDGSELFTLDLAAWTARQPTVGYGGPTGLLGLDLDSLVDDESDDDSFEDFGN